MRWNVIVPALLLSFAMAQPSFGFNALDRMLSGGCGCAAPAAQACCEKPCGAAADPGCGCAVADPCGCSADPGCGCAAADPCGCATSCCSKKPRFFEALFCCKKKSRSCGSSCGCGADPGCGCAAADPCGCGSDPGCGCAAADPCGCGSDPGCGCAAADPCGCNSGCKPRCKRRSLLDALFCHKRRCCRSSFDCGCAADPGCGCASADACGCGNGCGNGVVSCGTGCGCGEPMGPAVEIGDGATPDEAPMPPAPMADPNAHLSGGSQVMQASIVR